ncbi:EamA family transporter [Psychrobacter sp. I-STPA10]|uniref:EamA family transporter n=1 Tax=Psychrobacter sp. I-STPA10 TaxID=2585769 RepID=UPI001E3F978F|nr:EamA family transporter [Psychrobacter sp. I-STPA10]
MTAKHILLAVIVTIIWGVNFTFIAWGLQSFPPLMLTALRFFFTAIPLIFFIKRPVFSRIFFIYAIGTFVIQYAFVFTAMYLGASAGLSALLLQMQIFITVLLAYLLLGESLNRWQICGMAIGILGLAVIGNHLGGDMPVMGFICIIIAAIGWSFGNISSKQASKQASKQVSRQNAKQASVQTQGTSALSLALSLVVWGGLIACVLMTLVSLLFEHSAWQLATFTNASLTSWLSLGFIVYVSTLIGFGLWAYLLRQNPASKVTPFALLVPIFAMTTSVILTKEVLMWWKILAMVLILSGLLLSLYKPRYKPHVKQPHL